MKIATPRVTCIGATEFWYPVNREEDFKGWNPRSSSGPALIEFAGRACYQSWTRPNPATATNGGYIHHIIEVGHYSVLEHASASFYIEGVSRSFTHELVRHRHLSFSQLSQRYVDETNAEMVIPAVIHDNPAMIAVFAKATDAAQEAYDALVILLTEEYANVEDRTLRRKMARQAARAVLPNATETKIAVTGNLRAWRHFINLRATEHADVEIREIAIAILKKLMAINPAVFNDYTISRLDDGSEVAKTPFVTID